MTEWRLFDAGEPFFTTRRFFEDHPWVPPQHQVGHAARTAMTAELIRKVVADHRPDSITDLGCGDGSLLAELADLDVPAWGYDLGAGNLEVGTSRGVDVRYGDILDPTGLELGELVVACEVVEHLLDPHRWLRVLPATLLVLSSPAAETSDWHYEHHAWAWDEQGYRALVRGTGWRALNHYTCAGGTAQHLGRTGEQTFQALAAQRLDETACA